MGGSQSCSEMSRHGRKSETSRGTASPRWARKTKAAVASLGISTMSAVGAVVRKSDLSSVCRPSAVGS